MAPNLERYTLTFPETSRSLRHAMRAAIDDGSRRIEIVLFDEISLSVVAAEFRLRQTRYGDVTTEYLGELSDHGIATIIAETHPDLEATPARLTLARRPTP